MTQLLEAPGSIRFLRYRRQVGSAASTPRRFRPDIEGIRAFAVVSVVLYHAHLGVRGGFVGVDVFFVISGFLITRQLLTSVDRQGIRALPTFYTRRIRRLLPASATVVIATVVVARIWAPALQVRSIATDGLFTTFYGLNYRLAVEGTQYLHQTDAASPLQHFWSLGVEEQFYVFWPVLILLAAWIGRRFRTQLLFLALLATVVISFRYSVNVTKTNAPWAYFALHTRAWEMGIGALVAVCAPVFVRLPRRLAEMMAALSLVAMIASAFIYSDATAYPGSAAALPVLSAGVLIACGIGSRRKVERVLGEPLMQCLGKVSYAWYLWHWPMLVLAPSVLGHDLNVIDRIAVIWLSLVFSVVSYLLIEDPARKLSLSNVRWFSSGVLMSAAVLACGALVLTNLPSAVGNGAAVTVVQADTATPAVIAQMKAAIASGIQTKQAPRNLTPVPSVAAKDLPPSSSDGCHADFFTVNQGDCVYGDPAGTHTAVLFGDSHMEQWLPAMAEAATSQHWKIVNWTKAACPAAQLSVFAPQLNRQYTECDTWRSITLQRIATIKPDLVFVSQSENVASSSVSPATYAETLVQTLNKLKTTTDAKIEVLNDIPVPNFDAPTCVADHLSAVDKCMFTVKKAYTYPARHREVTKAIPAAGFVLIDPAGWLCTDSSCPAIVGNLLVYRNDTHMTATFSKWLTPMLAPLLTAKG